MKLSVIEDRSILLEDVYNGIGFRTRDGEEFELCMRDSGFEFKYNDIWYEAKEGIIKPLNSNNTLKKEENNTGERK